jgi:transforming growth factor-beta-induced protein
MKNKLFLLVFVLPLFLIQCSKDEIKTEIENEKIEISFDPASGIDFEVYEQDNQRSTFGSRFTFNTINAAINCLGIRDVIFSGSKTIYAPTDRAFAKLGLNPSNVCTIAPQTLAQLLQYHTSEGITSIRNKGCLEMLDGNIVHLFSKSGHRVNDSRIYFGSTIRGRDFRIRLYAISEVLSIPDKNIAETASEARIFSRLLTAVAAADPAILAALTNEDAVLTVFAPTDNAFAALFETLQVANLDQLVETVGIERVGQLLLYHVVDACAFSNNLSDGQTITTLQGETLEVDLSNLQIIDASRTGSGLNPELLDIRTSNGIIHGINRVLLPSIVL